MKSISFALISGLALVGANSLSMASHNSEESLVQRISAVGSLNIMTTEEAAAAREQATEQPMVVAASGDVDGETVYNGICVACHAAGVAGSPKLGDAAAWTDRIAQGMDVMVKNAIDGFQGKTGVMPPKGGNMALTDEEIAAAVQYMVDKSQ